MSLIDQDAREQALDITSSYIVQAPAGSGKTELLTQRFLNLLSAVEKYPEQVLAITFTKKAAQEMRQRIFACLEAANTLPEPDMPHQKQTWRLARQVLKRDKESGWNLLKNPNRLSVQTIDALCSGLVAKMPILSLAGGSTAITENPQYYYTEAAGSLINEGLARQDSWSDDVCVLLRHLDNRVGLAIELLSNLLGSRDQWLSHCLQARSTANLREILEANLQAIIVSHLQQLHAKLALVNFSELAYLLRYAAGNLGESNLIFSCCAELVELPLPTVENCKIYVAIAELLLTQTGEYRKNITKSIGFPSANTGATKEEKQLYAASKQRMIDLLGQLQANDQGLQDQLRLLRLLPEPGYTARQWQLLEALLNLLPLAAAKLQLVFQKHHKIDFIEVSLRALQSLGQIDEPTDLALCMDYRYQHLLIDEFQDTSVTQWELLLRLTAGWEENDGRTLFLVGDPMQSIYRFRQAEVGLFLLARDNGVGGIPLRSLKLQANFRSSARIVKWANSAMGQIFPEQENIQNGAVSYEQAVAVHEPYGEGVCIKVADSAIDEAEEVVNIITEALKDRGKSIAVLVRSRSHLQEIIPALLRSNVPFEAVDIDPINTKPLIQDALMLSRALMHLEDRIAWLAILRAPWLGLTLPSLTQLTQLAADTQLWQTLIDSSQALELPQLEQERVQRLIAVLKPIIYLRGRRDLADLVEMAWRNLGGNLLIQSLQDEQDLQAFFNCLRDSEKRGALVAGNEFVKAFSGIYTRQESSTKPQVQLMTIHKSKGLEFDTVIIPALDRKTGNDEHKLLVWHEDPNLDIDSSVGRAPIILAPIATSATEPSKIYAYVRNQQKVLTINETLRVLYVGVTRAKSNLYLVAKKTDKPASGSLLNYLWPVVANEFKGVSSEQERENVAAAPQSINKINRIKTEFLPPTVTPLSLSESSNNPVGSQHYLWRETPERHLGTLVHRILALIAKEGMAAYRSKNTVQLKIAWRKQLLFLGVSPKYCDQLTAKIEKVLSVIYTSATASWILKDHSNAECEYAVMLANAQTVTQGVIDRTFIENNIRWIIDYKMAEPKNDLAMDLFLQQQKDLYLDQMHRYGRLFGSEQNIKFMLYFPLIDQKIVWEFNNNSLQLITD